MAQDATLTQRDTTGQVMWMIGKIACIVFILEAGIMFFLADWHGDSELMRMSLIDASLLTGLASPLIYFWVARPFVAEADSVRAALSRQLDTSQRLLAQNEGLCLSLQEFSEVNADILEKGMQRAGADLHDGPAQMLTFSLLQIDRLAKAIERLDDPVKAAEFKELRGVIADTVQDIRAIARGLVLPELGSLTLPEVVELAVQRHRQMTGVSIQVEVQGPGGATLSQRACAYRVVQEALANACKHGKAKNIRISVSYDSAPKLSISDDGVGFAQPVAGNCGLGLAGMRARVQALGGQFQVASGAGGTTIKARFGAAAPGGDAVEGRV